MYGPAPISPNNPWTAETEHLVVQLEQSKLLVGRLRPDPNHLTCPVLLILDIRIFSWRWEIAILDTDGGLPLGLICLLIVEQVLEVGEKDLSLRLSLWIVKPLEDRPEGAVSSVTGLLALLGNRPSSRAPPLEYLESELYQRGYAVTMGDWGWRAMEGEELLLKTTIHLLIKRGRLTELEE